MIPEYAHFFGFLSIALGLGNAGYSIWLMAMGRTRPHAFSMLVWLLVASITFFNLLDQGAGAAAWRTGVGSLATLINFILCLRYGFGYVNRFDIGVLAGAFAAIPVWLLSSAALSLYWLIFIQVLGSVPNTRKAYHSPYDLSATVYTIAALGFLFQVLALEIYNLSLVLYFGILGSMFAATAAMLFVRRRSMAKQLSVSDVLPPP